MVSFFPNEACLLSLSINVFIETLAKWRYWNGHYIVLVVVIASEWMNMLCVYMSAILRSCFFFPFFFLFFFSPPYLIGLCILSLGRRHWNCTTAMGLHSCNLDVHSNALVGTLRCVRACVCTLLMAIAYAWDPFWVEGWTYSDNKSYLCIFFFLFLL